MEYKKADIGEIEEIYNVHMKRDFPPDELKPLRLITDAVKDGWYDFFAAYEDDKMLGYACLADCGEGMKFLDYFAVINGRRGGGIGSEFFKRLSYLSNAEHIVFETESVESAEDEAQEEIRKRRMAFYERNGAVNTGIKYVVFGVRYDIFIKSTEEINGELSEKACLAYEEAYEKILRRTDKEYIKRVK